MPRSADLPLVKAAKAALASAEVPAPALPECRSDPLPSYEGADALARLARRNAAGAKDLTATEYRLRAAGLAEAFAKEFRRTQSQAVELPLRR